MKDINHKLWLEIVYHNSLVEYRVGNPGDLGSNPACERCFSFSIYIQKYVPSYFPQQKQKNKKISLREIKFDQNMLVRGFQYKDKEGNYLWNGRSYAVERYTLMGGSLKQVLLYMFFNHPIIIFSESSLQRCSSKTHIQA